MKRRNLVAGFAAALALATAVPAEAQRYRGGRPPEIVVRSESGERVVHPGDRVYRRLLGNPYDFKPGRIYEYQDCGRYTCDILVIDYFGRQRFNNWSAPPPPWERGYGRHDRRYHYNRW